MEVEGACKSEERGLTRCRGGSQGTWEMHSSRCQSPHQAASLGPRRAPPRSRRAGEPSPGFRAPPIEISRYRFIGQSHPDGTIASLTSHLNDRVVEKFLGNGRRRIDGTTKRRRKRMMKRKKTRERLATKATPTSLACGDFVPAPCDHRFALRKCATKDEDASK